MGHPGARQVMRPVVNGLARQRRVNVGMKRQQLRGHGDSQENRAHRGHLAGRIRAELAYLCAMMSTAFSPIDRVESALGIRRVDAPVSRCVIYGGPGQAAEARSADLRAVGS